MSAGASHHPRPRPTPWWAWPLLPFSLLLFPLLFLLVPVYAVYWWLYPELHYTAWDEGMPREQEFIDRVRRYSSRVSFWTRLGRVLLVPVRGEPYCHGARRRARQKQNP